jgi:hypothetical protein
MMEGGDAIARSVMMMHIGKRVRLVGALAWRRITSSNSRRKCGIYLKGED